MPAKPAIPIIKNASAKIPRRRKSACKTYAATKRPVATIKPNVGNDNGPMCRYGIILW